MYTTTLRIVNYVLLEKEVKDALPPLPKKSEVCAYSYTKKKVS